MLENSTTANFNASNIHANLYTTLEAESTVEVNQVRISAFIYNSVLSTICMKG